MSEAKADAIYRVGVDIGGTFTDLILVETTSGAITVGKSLTTPIDPSEAVETVLRDALISSGVESAQVEHVIHGPGVLPGRRVGQQDLEEPGLAVSRVDVALHRNRDGMQRAEHG